MGKTTHQKLVTSLHYIEITSFFLFHKTFKRRQVKLWSEMKKDELHVEIDVTKKSCILWTSAAKYGNSCNQMVV
jgi:hypothetical protein